jgi:hypothetical protein
VCHSNGLIVISSDTVRRVGYWFSQMLHQRIRAALFLSVIARALPEYPAFVVMAPVFMMACAAFALTILFFFPGYLTRDASFVHMPIGACSRALRASFPHCSRAAILRRNSRRRSCRFLSLRIARRMKVDDEVRT